MNEKILKIEGNVTYVDFEAPSEHGVDVTNNVVTLIRVIELKEE